MIQNLQIPFRLTRPNPFPPLTFYKDTLELLLSFCCAVEERIEPRTAVVASLPTLTLLSHAAILDTAPAADRGDN
jgi:hypothetical protein